MISLNFLSRPDAHQDHRYVLRTLVYKSTTRDRQPCMVALWDRGRDDEEGAESAEKDLSVRGRAWNHSARRICSLALLPFSLLLFLVLLLLGLGQL